MAFGRKLRGIVNTRTVDVQLQDQRDTKSEIMSARSNPFLIHLHDRKSDVPYNIGNIGYTDQELN